jgi:hypothetical protein
MARQRPNNGIHTRVREGEARKLEHNRARAKEWERKELEGFDDVTEEQKAMNLLLWELYGNGGPQS